MLCIGDDISGESAIAKEMPVDNRLNREIEMEMTCSTRRALDIALAVMVNSNLILCLRFVHFVYSLIVTYLHVEGAITVLRSSNHKNDLQQSECVLLEAALATMLQISCTIIVELCITW